MKTNATAWALLMLGIAASPALADKASDARMAEEALLAHVRTKDPGMRNAHIENFQLGVETAALRAPDEARSATVIFNRGLVANEVVNSSKPMAKLRSAMTSKRLSARMARSIRYRLAPTISCGLTAIWELSWSTPLLWRGGAC